jgi:hypothetical protein
MNPDDGNTIPLLPCVTLEETLPFWQILGFEVASRQKAPNPYAVMRRGGYELHFFGLKGLKPPENFTMCLVIVPEVEQLHQTFAGNLREALGRTPSKGLPRITRMRPGQTRFTVTDPAGNSVIFIKQGPEDDEAAEAYKQPNQTPLERALNTAARLRDFKNDDAAAAKVLDNALARHEDAAPAERARVLAARIELAEAMGEEERAVALRAKLEDLEPSEDERSGLRNK